MCLGNSSSRPRHWTASLSRRLVSGSSPTAMLPKMQRGATLLLVPIFAVLSFSMASVSNVKAQLQPSRITKSLHKPSVYNLYQIYTLVDATDYHHMTDVLNKICIVRAVDTIGHFQVKEYIKSSLQNLNWTIESDIFEENTPIFGKLTFENIIARWNPNANRFLTLACHYDSKYEANYDFVGAIDSAVPCTQLINLAKVMQTELNSIKNNDLSLMLIFFDGEEAFASWSATDSLYGSRHLAAKWENTSFNNGNEILSELDKIDLFILLDLIGTPNPRFYNYFKNVTKWYKLITDIETRLAKADLFENYKYLGIQSKYFQHSLLRNIIEDDHLPFLHRNVLTMHMIPYPFPNTWHSINDNMESINLSTIENINKILRVFVASYLNMEVQKEEWNYDDDYN